MREVSARVRAVSPHLAVEQSTDHGPTRELLATLRAHDWGVKWRMAGTAMLVHPRFGTLEVEVAGDDRLVTFVDGRQVPHRIAMQRARGEV